MQKPKLKLHTSKLIAFAVVGLSAAASFAPSAFARPGDDGAPTEERRMGRGEGRGKRGGMNRRGAMRMMEHLNLSDAQKAQIQPIMQQAMADMRAVRQDTSLSPEAKRARSKAIRAASQARVQAILTPAQRAQMQQMAANRGIERGLDKMAATLNLTAAQKARLQPIMSRAQQQRRAIQTNASLSPAQKKTQLKALRESTQSQVDDILTPVQRRQIAAEKASRKQARREGKGKGEGRRNRNNGERNKGERDNDMNERDDDR